MLIFSFTLVLGLLAYMFSQELFAKTLTSLENEKKYEGRLKLSFKGKIFLLFLPLFFLTTIFAVMAADKLLAEQRGEFIYKNYRTQFDVKDEDTVTSVQDMKNVLAQIKKNSIKDTLFIITEKGVIYTDNEEEISIPADSSVRNFSYTMVNNQLYYRMKVN